MNFCDFLQHFFHTFFVSTLLRIGFAFVADAFESPLRSFSQILRISDDILNAICCLQNLERVRLILLIEERKFVKLPFSSSVDEQVFERVSFSEDFCWPKNILTFFSRQSKWNTGGLSKRLWLWMCISFQKSCGLIRVSLFSATTFLNWVIDHSEFLNFVYFLILKILKFWCLMTICLMMSVLIQLLRAQRSFLQRIDKTEVPHVSSFRAHENTPCKYSAYCLTWNMIIPVDAWLQRSKPAWRIDNTRSTHCVLSQLKYVKRASSLVLPAVTAKSSANYESGTVENRQIISPRFPENLIITLHTHCWCETMACRRADSASRELLDKLIRLTWIRRKRQVRALARVQHAAARADDAHWLIGVFFPRLWLGSHSNPLFCS